MKNKIGSKSDSNIPIIAFTFGMLLFMIIGSGNYLLQLHKTAAFNLVHEKAQKCAYITSCFKRISHISYEDSCEVIGIYKKYDWDQVENIVGICQVIELSK